MGVPTCLVLSSNEVSNTSIGVVVYKEAHGNPQITQIFSMTAVCSPHNDSKAPLLEATPPQLYIEPSLHVLAFHIERPYACYQNVKKTASTPLLYNSVLLHDILGNGGTNLEITNQYVIPLKAQSTR